MGLFFHFTLLFFAGHIVGASPEMMMTVITLAQTEPVMRQALMMPQPSLQFWLLFLRLLLPHRAPPSFPASHLSYAKDGLTL